jgi:hypothetical protein
MAFELTPELPIVDWLAELDRVRSLTVVDPGWRELSLKQIL